MEASTVQTLKLALVSMTGLSKDALHIYVGLAVFLLTAFILRKSLRSLIPLVVVLIAAVAGELLDRRDDLLSLGRWRWGASLHDVINTLFWPTVLWLVFRLSPLFSGGHDPSTGPVGNRSATAVRKVE